jgi:hypothetical protein
MANLRKDTIALRYADYKYQNAGNITKPITLAIRLAEALPLYTLPPKLIDDTLVVFNLGPGNPGSGSISADNVYNTSLTQDELPVVIEDVIGNGIRYTEYTDILEMVDNGISTDDICRLYNISTDDLSLLITNRNANTYENKILPNRYIFITKVRSVLTLSKALLYYDTLYKDIIIIPNTENYDPLVLGGRTMDMQGYVVSFYSVSTNNGAISTIAITEETKYTIPKIKSNINAGVSVNLIPGYFLRFGNIDTQVELQFSSGYNILRREGTPAVVINLGKVSDIFEESGTLPLYSLQQHSPSRFGVYPIGVLPTSDIQDRNLYILLNM